MYPNGSLTNALSTLCVCISHNIFQAKHVLSLSRAPSAIHDFVELHAVLFYRIKFCRQSHPLSLGRYPRRGPPTLQTLGFRTTLWLRYRGVGSFAGPI
jgi:hypothetical protein